LQSNARKKSRSAFLNARISAIQQSGLLSGVYIHFSTRIPRGVAFSFPDFKPNSELEFFTKLSAVIKRLLEVLATVFF